MLGEIATDVFAAIEGKGQLGPLISGTLDLDNLDNVVRLAFHMGLCSDEHRALPVKLATLLQPVEGGLAAPEVSHPMFEQWFDLRRRLYEFLLLDRGEFAAKAMLTMAVELAVEAQLLGPDDWRLTDDGLLDALHDRSVGDHQTISQLIKRLRVGDLFECIGVWQTPVMSEYGRLSEAAAKRDLERTIENRLGHSGPKLRICLHYILDNKKTCRSLSFRNLDTGLEEIVGYDSATLLVGAFITNSRSAALSSSERRRTSQVVTSALEADGLGRLSPAPEPLSDAPDAGELF